MRLEETRLEISLLMVRVDGDEWGGDSGSWEALVYISRGPGEWMAVPRARDRRTWSETRRIFLGVGD